MKRLPSYAECKEHFPLIDPQRFFIEKNRETVRSILSGTDSRLLLIVGPCSIHDPRSAIEFAKQVRKLASSISPHFFLIMRVYCEKPRTSSGWKGFLFDPYLDGSHHIQVGIERTRQLLLDLADMQMPAACEFLDPLTAFYYDDLITWGSIGARTSSSQTHRQLASQLAMPVGFKNGIAGNISAAVHGVLAASLPHTYMGLDDNGYPTIKHAPGNPDAHVVLRGGDAGPNYDPSSVSHTLIRLENLQLPPRLLIDCSHQNSGKKYDQQPGVFQSVIHQIAEGNTNIRGLMLESHLFAGKQPLVKGGELKYGISITDSCLDWPSTAHLIQWSAQHLQQQMTSIPSVHLI